jgi:hypothetical protein
MGQYWIIFNITQKQHFSASAFNSGVKLWEMMMASEHWGAALGYLLAHASSNGSGGGDLDEDQIGDYFGSWAGDNVQLIGDYAAPHPVPDLDASTDIGPALRREMLPIFQEMEGIKDGSTPSWIVDQQRIEEFLLASKEQEKKID